MGTRHDEIKASYKQLGGSFANFYDGIITRSTWTGKLADSVVWGLNAEKAAKWVNDALAPIPEGFSGRLLEVPVGTGVLTMPLYKSLPEAEITCLDYSDGMIAEAKKGDCPDNLIFEVADAMRLPYAEDSFDAVIISNALHVVSDPEQVLREIDRVLCPGGLLIAPNFVEHKGTFGSRLWSGVLRLAGIKFEHQWSSKEYLRFLETNGWQVGFHREMPARITLLYAECERKEQG